MKKLNLNVMLFVIALILSVTNSFSQTGDVLWERFNGYGGDFATLSADITTVPTATQLLTSLDAPVDVADGYKARIKGFLFISPAEAGDYYFYIASDDQSEFWLSTDVNPANKTKRCEVTGWASHLNWTANASQKSALITLASGVYYFEMLHSEGGGGDNLSLGWAKSTAPGTITVVGSSNISQTGDCKITFSANNPANDIQKGNNRPIYILKTEISGASATLNNLTLKTGGTYTGTDISNFKIWYNTAASMIGAVQIGSTIANAASGTDLAFATISKAMPAGDNYIILTCDIDAAATEGNTINIEPLAFANIDITSNPAPTKLGTDPVAAGGAQTIIAQNSSASDIIFNAGFTTPENILYKDFQGTTLDATNSIEVAQFTVRDGGGAADPDSKNTILNDVTFNITNSQFLRKVAIFDGTTLIASADAAATVVFGGLSAISAPDDGSKTFSVRVSFKSIVTDNQQISMKIPFAGTLSAGSGFAAIDAGAAQSVTTADANRIEVVASSLDFTTQPWNRAIDQVAMERQPVITARDANANVDLDYVLPVTLDNSNSNVSTGNVVTAVAGVATFTSLTFTAIVSDPDKKGGVTLTATDGTLSGTSSNFEIVKPISGVKTITATGGDYAKIADAVNDLNSRGTGPGGVTFVLTDGETYVVAEDWDGGRHFTINSGARGTKDRPIVFKRSGNAGDPNPPVLDYQGNQWDRAITVRGANYVTIDGFKITRLSAGGIDWAIGFEPDPNGSKYCTVKNCIFDLDLVNAGNNGCIHTNCEGQPYPTGMIKNLTISGCEFIKATTGVWLKGNWNDGITADSNSIIGNKFHDMKWAHNIVFEGQKAFVISGNEFYNTSVDVDDDWYRWPSAMVLRGNSGICKIDHNIIHNMENKNTSGDAAFRAIFMDSYGSSRINIFNNMIYDIKAPASSYNEAVKAFEFTGAGEVSLVNNTVYFDYTTTNATNGCVIADFSVDSLTVINNSFNLNATLNGGSQFIYNFWWRGKDRLGAQTNNNRYFVKPGSKVRYFARENNNVEATDFAKFKSFFTIIEQASDTFALETDLPFASIVAPYDMHIKQGASMADGKAVSYITDDVDRDPRNIAKPTVGADEARNPVSILIAPVTATEAAKTKVVVSAKTKFNVATDQTIDVQISGTGITGTDYTLTSASITIPAGASVGTDTVKILDDADIEGTEKMYIKLINPSADILPDPSKIQDSVIIIDNDFPPVDLSVSANSGDEAAQTTITVSATTLIAVTGDQQIKIAVSGIGITAEDFQLGDSIITIPNGQKTGSVTFKVLDDVLIEPTENALISIATISAGLSMGTTTSQTIAIASDDKPTVDLTASANAGGEATADVITITATASDNVIGAQTVTLAVSGNGVTAGDYTLSSLTITIPDGQKTGTATFTIVDDAVVEPKNDTAKVEISAVSAGLLMGTTTSQAIVIVDNDIKTVNLSVSATDGNEEGSTVITVKATASGPAVGAQTVDLAVTGTGITAGDYTLSSTTITIANGATEGTVTFTVTDDVALEGLETATLTISNPSIGLVLGSTKTQNIIIHDNDIIEVNLSASANTGTETDKTVITLTATAAKALTSDETLTVNVSGTGITAADYALSNTTLTIATGQTTGTVTFTINDDAAIEGTETAAISISNPSAGLSLGATTSQDVAIADNDFPAVNLSVSTNNTSEQAKTAVTITATAAQAVVGAQTVKIKITGSATITADYTLTDSTITIANGATTGTVTFTVVDDAVIEGLDSAVITMSTPTAGIVLGNTLIQKILIADNDFPSVTLSASVNAGTEVDQTVITLTATASQAVIGAQTMDVKVSGTNITSADYALSNAVITIANGATTGTVTFTISDDNLFEGTETAVITISNPSAGIMLGSTVTQNIVITDNDPNALNEEISNIQVYPNPAVEVLNIKTEGSFTQYSISDANGKVIATKNVQSGKEISVSVKELSAGIYFITLEGASTQVVKFIKE